MYPKSLAILVNRDVTREDASDLRQKGQFFRVDIPDTKTKMSPAKTRVTYDRIGLFASLVIHPPTPHIPTHHVRFNRPHR